MMQLILESLYLMLPAYFANMAPVIFKWIPLGATPIDFGKKWKGTRIAGDNKTWRGLFAGVLGGIIIVALQKKFAATGAPIALLQYENFGLREILLFGIALGGGALLGDLIKSIFKRRIGIDSGQPWIPFDQIDLAIGALIGLSFLYIPSLAHIIIIILSGILSFVANVIAYFLRIKKVWW